MSVPFLSIVSITYQDVKGLTKTLASVSEQTNRNFEHIIIDGDSHDGTKELLAQAQVDKKVSEPDKGIFDAMNKGLALCEGEWVLFLNGGDVFADENVLERVEKFIKENSVADFIYGDYILLKNGCEYVCPAHSFKRLWWGNITSHQAMLFKRSVLDKARLRYDAHYRIAGDYKFILEYSKQVKEPVYLPLPIAKFDSTGISNQNVKLGREEALQARQEVLGYGAIRCGIIRLLQMCAQIAAHSLGGAYRLLRGYKKV